MNKLSAKRSTSLDGLRGLAAVQVMVIHYYLLTPDLVDNPWLRVLNAYSGVTAFFTLSGFLISGILFDHAGSPNLLRTFYVRRSFRILPLYWVLLASFLLVRMLDNRFHVGLIPYWYGNSIPFWRYLTFTQNNELIGPLWLAVTWTLAVEEQFYLVFPWIVQWLSVRMMVIIALASILLCPVIQLVSGTKNLPSQLNSLLAGVLVALALRNDRWSGWLQRHRSVVKRSAGALLVGGFIVTGWISDIRDWLVAVSPVLFAAVVYVLYTEETGSRLSRVMQLFAPLGVRSYFIYLFHWPVVFFLSAWFAHPRMIAPFVLLLLAWVSYRYFERPLINQGGKFSYQTA